MNRNRSISDCNKYPPDHTIWGGANSSENLFQQSTQPAGFRFSRRCKILSYLFNKNGKLCFILLCFFHRTNPLECPLYQATAIAAYLSEREKSPLAEGRTCNAYSSGLQLHRAKEYQEDYFRRRHVFLQHRARKNLRIIRGRIR